MPLTRLGRPLHLVAAAALCVAGCTPQSAEPTEESAETADSTAQPGPNLELPGAYDPDNLLAKTLRGEIPSVVLYEDDRVSAFLADRPSARGHFLVVLKNSQARNFIEVAPEDMSAVMAAARRVAQAEITAIGAQGFTLRQNNGSASSIAQYHLHVVPRWPDDEPAAGMGPVVAQDELEAEGEQIRAALPAQ